MKGSPILGSSVWNSDELCGLLWGSPRGSLPDGGQFLLTFSDFNFTDVSRYSCFLLKEPYKEVKWSLILRSHPLLAIKGADVEVKRDPCIVRPP